MGKTAYINLCIIGAGRLGTTISRAFAGGEQCGIKLKAVSSRTGKSLIRVKKALGEQAAGIYFTKNNTEAASVADCVLICTPDDTIKRVCAEIFKEKKRNHSKKYYIIHFSGSKSLKVLDAARAAGAEVASVHPLKSFASIDEAIKTLPGTVFGLTYSSKKSREIAEKLVKCLGGEIIFVDDNKKPLYHAAACVASNYLVTLLDYAVRINQKIGINPQDSLKGLMNLAEGTLENIKRMGTAKSLTGPIARGDTGTIKEHMESFKKFFTDEEMLIYRIMGIETAKIAYRNKWLKEKILKELKEILGE